MTTSLSASERIDALLDERYRIKAKIDDLYYELDVIDEMIKEEKQNDTLS